MTALIGRKRLDRDGLLSAVPTLLNFDSYNAHRKWIGDILRTQRGSGQIACIAPTSGWGLRLGQRSRLGQRADFDSLDFISVYRG